MLMPVVLFLVSIMIFSLTMFLSPTQRVAAYAPSPAHLRGGKEKVESLIEQYGLNDPVYKQYVRWINNIFHGNLGWSSTLRMPVGDALQSLFPATAELAILAFIPIILGAIWMGSEAAIHHNSLPDHFIRIFTIVGWSFPTFVFGLIVLMVFYGKFSLFPPGRLSQWANEIVNSSEFIRYTGFNIIDSLLNGNFQVLLDSITHLFLPVITLSYVIWANMTRIMRSSMLNVLHEDYITTARAKGLKENVVNKKHGRRNALLPVLTVAGLLVARLMGGVVITETIFDYRGLGRFAANAAVNLDFPAVIGFALYFSVILVFVNLIVDVLYAYLDPRVQLE